MGPVTSVRIDCPGCGEEIDVEFVPRGRQVWIEFVSDPVCPECGAGLDECWLEAKAAEALV